MNEPRPTLHPSQQGHPAPTGQPRPAAHAPPAPPQRPTVVPPTVRTVPSHDPHENPIAIDGDEGLLEEVGGGPPSPAAVGPSATTKIRFGAGEHLPGHDDRNKYKRPTHSTGTGICRVRTFHGRLSDEGMAYMDDKINDWLDRHPEVEVKFVTTAIGVYEGKIKEPALVVNVWH